MPFREEHNAVRSLDFIEYVTRSGWLRDFTSEMSPLAEEGKPKQVLDIRVPEGETWFVLESLVTVLGNRGARLHLHGTPPGGSETKRFVLVTAPESTDYRRVIRRSLPGGYRYRITAEASPAATTGNTKLDPAKNQLLARWTFATLPWVD